MQKDEVRDDIIYAIIHDNKIPNQMSKDKPGMVQLVKTVFNLGVKIGKLANTEDIHNLLPHRTTIANNLSKNCFRINEAWRDIFIKKAYKGYLANKKVPCVGITGDLWSDKGTGKEALIMTASVWNPKFHCMFLFMFV